MFGEGYTTCTSLVKFYLNAIEKFTPRMYLAVGFHFGDCLYCTPAELEKFALGTSERRLVGPEMADAARWQTSNQAYGAFYKLPPRARARNPQHTLLVALAPVTEPPSRERADQAAAAPHTGPGASGAGCATAW